jgi:hypothetical protein
VGESGLNTYNMMFPQSLQDWQFEYFSEEDESMSSLLLFCKAFTLGLEPHRVLPRFMLQDVLLSDETDLQKRLHLSEEELSQMMIFLRKINTFWGDYQELDEWQWMSKKKYLREYPSEGMDFVAFFNQRHDKFDWSKMETFGDQMPEFTTEEKDDSLVSKP